MAKNTTLKTRIQNRHDTEANWTTASNATKPFIPLKGEIIVYDPDTTNTSPRVKIGDGVTKVGNLAFVGGNISNFVTTDTEQTISSLKSFSQGINVNGVNDKFGNNLITVGSNGILVGSSVGGDNSALILCGKAPKPKYSTDGGTTSVELALISDIPSIPTNYVTTDTAQTISGVKTFTGAIQLQGVGIAAKVGGENSSYTNILKGGGNVVEVGSTGYQTRIYSNGRISVYDYSTSPYTSEKVAYQSEIPTIPTDNLTKSNFNTQMAEGFSLEDDVNGGLTTVVPNSIIVKNRASSGQQIEVKSSGIIYSRDAENIKTTINFVDNPNITINMPSTSGTLLTDADLSIAPIKVKDTFVASSWATSSAATDTQFGKYYKDVTIPNKNIINVRCVSTKGMSGITLDYAPEIKCNNRRTSDTNLRIYSNSQLEGAVTITLVGDTLPNKFSKTNATLSTSSWTTSSATVDTQFAKYYTDITVPAGDVMNIRILSNEDITGISTAAYYPEVWSDNRKINSTTLRVYSNKQVAGSVIILTMEV